MAYVARDNMARAVAALLMIEHQQGVMQNVTGLERLTEAKRTVVADVTGKLGGLMTIADEQLRGNLAHMA